MSSTTEGCHLSDRSFTLKQTARNLARLTTPWDSSLYYYSTLLQRSYTVGIPIFWLAGVVLRDTAGGCDETTSLMSSYRGVVAVV